MPRVTQKVGVVQQTAPRVFEAPRRHAATSARITRQLLKTSQLLTSVPPGVGLFPPLAPTFFCHHYAKFSESCPGRGAAVCLSWVRAGEWMALRHRLRSLRETQMLMGLQAEATSREEDGVMSATEVGPEVRLGIVNSYKPYSCSESCL